MARSSSVDARFAFPFDSATWAAVVVELKLSPQLARVVELLLLAKRDKQIAAELGVSKPTVRTYLSRIFIQLGAADRAEVVLRVFAVASRLQRVFPVVKPSVIISDDITLDVAAETD